MLEFKELPLVVLAELGADRLAGLTAVAGGAELVLVWLAHKGVFLAHKGKPNASILRSDVHQIGWGYGWPSAVFEVQRMSL
jgi:hypothetical protein